MNATSYTPAPQPSVARNPVAFAFLTGTSFIGIYWLLEPLFDRVGWHADGSRWRLLFVGTVYAVLMTWFRRARAASTSRPAA